jgi:hypothetical protein
VGAIDQAIHRKFFSDSYLSLHPRANVNGDRAITHLQVLSCLQLKIYRIADHNCVIFYSAPKLK